MAMSWERFSESEGGNEGEESWREREDRELSKIPKRQLVRLWRATTRTPESERASSGWRGRRRVRG
jgi:hypothetical protein